MILYEVYSEGYSSQVPETWWPSKAAAITEARRLANEGDYATVYRVVIKSPISVETACRMLEHEGFSSDSTTVREFAPNDDADDDDY